MAPRSSRSQADVREQAREKHRLACKNPDRYTNEEAQVDLLATTERERKRPHIYVPQPLHAHVWGKDTDTIMFPNDPANKLVKELDLGGKLGQWAITSHNSRAHREDSSDEPTVLDILYLHPHRNLPGEWVLPDLDALPDKSWFEKNYR